LNLTTRLRRRALGDAAYVCPLFLDRAAYRWHIYLSALRRRVRIWDDHPYDIGELLVNHGTGRLNLDRVPILAEHICIRPHCTVSSAKHMYSFSESGGDLCFHSPESLPEGSKPLGRWLSGLWNRFAESDGSRGIDRGTALESLRGL